MHALAIASLAFVTSTVSTFSQDAVWDINAPAVVHADVVALDQTIVYNRFGSFDPYGMIFALQRDVSAVSGFEDQADAKKCASATGAESGIGALEAGKVRLKDCKRPRPLVLRGRVGDVLRVHVTNLLRQQQPGLSETFCREAKQGVALPNINAIRDNVSERNVQTVGAPTCEGNESGQPQPVANAGQSADWPRTRGLSFAIPGLEPIPGPGNRTIPKACIGTGSIRPGASETCYYRLDREGTHLFQSLAAPAGGEGDGGSLTHGLFGALIVEPKGSSFFRSQVSMAAFDNVWERDRTKNVPHARLSTPDYAKAVAVPTPEQQRSVANPCISNDLVPVAAVMRDCGTFETIALAGPDGSAVDKSFRAIEIVHGDLNAIIVPPAVQAPAPAAGTAGADEYAVKRRAAEPFREFVVIFHDELKSYYTKAFEELGNFEQFSGIRDGFAINYGASGAGSLVLANRKKIGPAAACPECMYEEFFLESWANGDPALLENFVDDPSNVHHSYLNDRVVFRNFHAGPKETHVFHLHSHQWFAGNDKNRGAYLDSQTIGPQQGMSYDIYGGGTELYRPGANGEKGWWETLGSGNRNRTPGDAIFHCHLYPHFAQGMWELWRVHDVLEDGTRTLPDGQSKAGLSLKPNTTPTITRPGTSPDNGAGPALWPVTSTPVDPALEGTPIPGLIPVPRQASPLLATYDANKGFPGYPFYIAGKPGHRTPQAPMDIAVDTQSKKRLDGGLGRHVITGGERISDVAARADATEMAKYGITKQNGVLMHKGEIVPITTAQKLAIGDLTEEFARLTIELLPPNGTRLERRAMAFHNSGLLEGRADEPTPDVNFGKLQLRKANGDDLAVVPGNAAETADILDKVAYQSVQIPDKLGDPSPAAHFPVNGAPPRPGAPFADPCGVPDRLRNMPMSDPYQYATGANYAYGNKRPESIRGAVVGGSDKFFAKAIGSEDYPPALMTYDPALSGFRRFEASVIQFDMVVNKAGWHDPQARINVLTRDSHLYKPGGPRAVSAREEPFYFRAFSGDCIEFRHTNESPHKLGLDDFQTKVPTDTIGQHIHLVKFDVTSSDGSGNGWNYEDGTFAPDELKERIHASEPAKGGALDVAGLSQADRDEHDAGMAVWKQQCDSAAINGSGKLLWELNREDHKACFQTTVQRWFADPVLSLTGENGNKGARYSDRTLRTVFTHDHFGPSNIQQHGFYSALLIEPTHKTAVVYDKNRTGDADNNPGVTAGEWALVDHDQTAGCVEPTKQHYADLLSPVAATRDAAVAAIAACSQEPTLVDADQSGNGVGARARVFETLVEGRKADPYHPDYREFALAIADFALLYDGRKAPAATPKPVTQLDGGGESDGLDRLIGEANLNRNSQAALAASGSDAPNICVHNRGNGKPETDPGSIGGLEVVPPAQAVACEIHENKTAKAWLLAAREQVRERFDHLRENFGKPVYPPDRPEAISQTHHDPYLVNYQNEPIPLRVGSTSSGVDLNGNGKCFEVGQARAHADQLKRQKTDDSGDMARVFRSLEHGDPCTPLLEAYADENVLFRIIQGAQEVQHLFTVEGRSFRRNVDQAYAFGARVGAEEDGRDPTRWERCVEAGEFGRPWHWARWFSRVRDSFDKQTDSRTWLERYRMLVAECDNVEGLTTAQEIGISEHFEVGGRFSSSANVGESSKSFVPGDGSVNSALPLRDSVYHFGTMDAQWNGAWGLLRVYANDEVPDTTACLETASSSSERAGCLAGSTVGWSAVGERILSLPKAVDANVSESVAEKEAYDAASTAKAFDPRETFVDAKSFGPTEATSPDLSCPFIPEGVAQNGTGNDTRHVFAALVATSARDLGLNGIDYDKAAGLYDPDGLMFVPLDMSALGFTSDEIFQQERLGPTGNDGSFGALTRGDVVAAAKARMVGGELPPAVLRMNAGECLHLVVVNTLRTTKTIEVGSSRLGLSDVPGDAAMPRITKLNVDQHLTKGRESQDTGIGEIAPSASLAVSIPLTSVTNVNDVPDPVGINPRTALRPATDSSAPYTIQTFFGGAISHYQSEFDKVISNALKDSVRLTSVTLKDESMTCQNAASQDVEAARPTIYPDRVSGSMCVPNPQEPGKYQQPTEIGWGSTACSFAPALPAKPYHYVVWPADYASCTTGRDVVFNVMGRRYCATTELDLAAPDQPLPANWPAPPAPSQSEVEACTRLAVMDYAGKQDADVPVAGLAKANLRITARAYGTLPIKSMSDPISHASHGLAGTLIVEPRGSTYPDQEIGNPVSIPKPADLVSLNGVAVPATPIGEWKSIIRLATQPSLDIALGAVALPLALEDSNGGPPMRDDPPAQNLAATTISEHSLLWQDGLNLWDTRRPNFFGSASQPKGGPVPDCEVCDDSYDLGDKAVNYRSGPLFARVRGASVPDYVASGTRQVTIPSSIGPDAVCSRNNNPVYHGGLSPDGAAVICEPEVGEGKLANVNNLNAWPMPENLFSPDFKDVPTPVMVATQMEIAIRIAEPQGRARQRAFVPLGAGYQDMLPGFGSGHSTLIAPGKAVTAGMRRPATPGHYLWFDGPRPMLDGGAWGLLEVK